MPEPKRHLSLYLMKAGTSIDEAIRDPSRVSRHDLVNIDSDGALFVKTSHGQVPWWVEFLDPLSSDDLRAPESRTTSAVLSLSLKTTGGDLRTVCYTFGHGRHLLDQDRIDRSFGLRVTLNTIDPAKLRGLDTRRQEDIVVNSRSQSSIGTDMASFNLNEYRDILTKATGSTTGDHIEVLGGSVHGSDGISFDVSIQVGELADRAHHLLSLYQLERYKELFPFVDHILPVDPEKSDELDRMLASALRALLTRESTDFRCLYLASPEILDLEELEGYVFSSERGRDKTVHPELSLTDYIGTRQNAADSYTIKTAKRDDVLLRSRDQTNRRLSSVYRCLIAEIEREDATYQLVDGRWYEVDGSFVEQINLEVSSILSATTSFPPHIVGETEENYNSRVAHGLGALLMDRKNIPLGGGSNRIEFCDMAFLDRTIVHAKKRTYSSALSHLWSQGTVSITALLSDNEFRNQVRSRIQCLDPAFIHIVDEGLTGSDYTIVYLIIGVDSVQQAWESLPFFSRVALAQACNTLSSMNVDVRIAGVPSI